VSDERFTAGDQQADDRGRATTFGMRTAALAGIVISAGALAVGLAGPFDDATGVAYTTCCPPHHESVE